MPRTQRDVLRSIDEKSRRALRTGEESDVRALLTLYDEALDDIETLVRGQLAELQSVPAGSWRATFLRWKSDREEQLAGQIRRRLNELRDNWTLALRDGLLRQTTEQLIFDGYAIDQATPPSFSIDTRGMTATIPDAIVSTPWQKTMFSDAIWNLTDDMAREIQQQVAQGALSGEGVSKIVRRIRDLDVLDGNVPPRYAIERLARTELMKGSDRARQLLYAENSDVVDGEEIVATLDDRTCEICGPLDGLQLGSREATEHLFAHDAEDRPPFHPSCRCTTIPILSSWKDLLGPEAPDDLDSFDDDERVVRDPETGKSVTAPYQTFGEWQASKLR